MGKRKAVLIKFIIIFISFVGVRAAMAANGAPSQKVAVTGQAKKMEVRRNKQSSFASKKLMEGMKLKSGTESGGGGGDYNVIEFLTLSRELISWLEISKVFSHEEIGRIVKTVNSLEATLNGAEPARLQFVEKKIFDQNGTPKAAYFDSELKTIWVQRELWMVASKRERYSLVMIEIIGASGLQNRYSQVTKFSNFRSANGKKCQQFGNIVESIHYDRIREGQMAPETIERESALHKYAEAVCVEIQETESLYLVFSYFPVVSGFREGDLLEIVSVYLK